MSTNVQVRVITGKFKENAIETIARETMPISRKKDFIHILVHEGVLENGIIKEEKVEENRR